MKDVFAMRILLITLLIGFLLNGCVKNNPLPVWLEINEWTLESNPLNTNGEPDFLSHNFTDVWVYVDNKVIGVFEVPCKIPILINGENKNIKLYPAIRNNGISSTKKLYPFTEGYNVNMNLVAGETYTFNPITRYTTAVKFWTEDFDSNQAQIEPDNTFTTADWSIESDPLIELSGNFLHIAPTTANSLWVGVTTEALTLPKGSEVYLEVDYRNTAPILTGVKAINTTGTITDNPNVSMNAQSATDVKWKKIYIQLGEIVSYSTSAYTFKQYFKVQLPETLSSADVYIDNIHVVYF